MGLEVDWFNKLILVTSPTTSVDGQVLHDFIEDQMATPRGMTEVVGEVTRISLLNQSTSSPMLPPVFRQSF